MNIFNVKDKAIMSSGHSVALFWFLLNYKKKHLLYMEHLNFVALLRFASLSKINVYILVDSSSPDAKKYVRL